MLYQISTNNTYSQLRQLPKAAQDYTFYRNGCVINKEKANKIIKQGKQDTFIIAQRKKKEGLPAYYNLNHDQQQKEQIKKYLTKEENELFHNNTNTLFQQFTQFKYLHLKEDIQELQQSERGKVQQQFMRDQAFNTQAQEQLEYVTANWRQMMKKVCHKRTTQSPQSPQ